PDSLMDAAREALYRESAREPGNTPAQAQLHVGTGFAAPEQPERRRLTYEAAENKKSGNGLFQTDLTGSHVSSDTSYDER
ncbi:MAG: hypothetical protein GWO26_11235, partial [Phycisphaerae bacterium]|nr:hypothetical protein [Phycisphaerae bacterium]